MYYAVFDLQTGDYLASGSNLTNRKAVKNDILSLMYWDIQEDYNKYKRMSLNNLLEIWDMRLDKSDTEFTIDF